MYKENFKKGGLLLLTSCCLFSNVAFGAEKRVRGPRFVQQTINNPQRIQNAIALGGRINGNMQGLNVQANTLQQQSIAQNQQTRQNLTSVVQNANANAATAASASTTQNPTAASASTTQNPTAASASTTQVQSNAQQSISSSNGPIAQPLSKEKLKDMQEKQQNAGFNALVSAVDGVFDSIGSQAFRESQPASGEQALAHGLWFGTGFSFGNANYQGSKFKPKTTVFTLGYDTEVSENVAIGAFASIINLQNSSKSLNLKQKEQYTLGGVYGNGNINNLNLQSVFAFGYGSGKLIDNNPVEDKKSSNTTKNKNLAYGYKLRAGYQLPLGDVTFEPFTALRYLAIANGTDAHANNEKKQNLAADAGLKVAGSIPASDFNINPYLTVGKRFDIIDSASDAGSRRSRFFTGVGVDAQNQSFDFGLKVATLYAKNYKDYSFILKALAKF